MVLFYHKVASHLIVSCSVHDLFQFFLVRPLAFLEHEILVRLAPSKVRYQARTYLPVIAATHLVHYVQCRASKVNDVFQVLAAQVPSCHESFTSER